MVLIGAIYCLLVLPLWLLVATARWILRQFVSADSDWTSIHARLLPFGSTVGTYLAANFVGEGEWLFWDNWKAIINAASLGVIMHGIAAVGLLEGGFKVGLYVVDKWRVGRAKARAKDIVHAMEFADSESQKRRIMQTAFLEGISQELLEEAAMIEGVRLPTSRRFARRRRPASAR